MAAEMSGMKLRPKRRRVNSRATGITGREWVGCRDTIYIGGSASFSGGPALLAALVIAGLATLQIAALYCAWRAVVSSRTPQGAFGWVVFLLAAP